MQLRWLGFVDILATAGFALGCGGSNTLLQEDLAALVSQGDGTVVRMAEVSCFKWDRFHVFPPYTTSQEIYQQLGFHWPTAERTEIQMLDTFTLLVFAEASEVVAFVKYPRYLGDFSEARRDHGFSPADAVFVVREEDHGGPWLMVRPVPLPAA